MRIGGHLVRVMATAVAVFTLSVPVQAASSPHYVTALPAYYGFSKTITLTNTGKSTALNVSAHVVLLGPTTPYAHVTLTGESRSPAHTFKDQFGNVIGQFDWSRLKPGQSVTLTLHYQATSSDITYHVPLQLPSYSHNALYKFYTNPHLEHSKGVDTGAPQIVQLDKTVTRGIASPYLQAHAMFNWIVHNIRYNYSLKPSGSALNTLSSHLGICSDFAELYVSMLRTKGIPARLVGGYVTNNGANQGGFHQWVEFYLPKFGWVVADPTWGRLGYFAALQDDWHIPLYDGIRSDISVHWQYASTSIGRPNLAIHYHYLFVTEQSAPTTKSVNLPLLSVPPAVSVHHAELSPWQSLLLHWKHLLEVTYTQIIKSLVAFVQHIPSLGAFRNA